MDTEREAAIDAIRQLDHRLTPTSETSLLTDALYELRHQPDTAATLRWWSRAYHAYEAVMGDPTAAEDFLTDLFEGRLDFGDR